MDVLMPQLGETVKEGTVSVWFKKVGDKVTAGDNLFEIETDKVSMEVQATESGVLSEICITEGQTCRVGEIIAVIGGKVATTSRAAKPTAAAAIPAAVKQAEAPSLPAAAPPINGASLLERGFAPFNEVFTPSRNYGPAKTADGMRITPLARRLIAQNNLDLAAVVAQVRNAGRNRIGADDVNATLNAPMAARQKEPVFQIPGDREIISLNRIRQQTAKHLQTSWQTIPHVLQTMEIDFGAVSAVRDAKKESFRNERGIALTYLPFIARAVCLALRAFPNINAAFDGEKLHVARQINFGIAVDLSHNGLVVPVIKNADGYNVAGLAIAISTLSEKARASKLVPSDIEGGTYSISNNGSFGTLFTAPIINAPQVAILSTDAIRKRPLVKETEYGDIIAIRPVGIIAQSFDHRAFDGAYSAAYLSHLKDIIETRNWAAEF